MRPPNNQWPATPAGEGTLFFAQAMQEFLEEKSFEGFRAYSLDTIARLNEARALAIDVQQGRVPRPTLSPVDEELIWSLAGDDVLKENAPFETSLLAEACQQNIAISQFVNLLEMIIARASPDYQAALADKVASSVNDPQSRIALLRSTGFLVSHLLNDGHSRDFLLEKLNQKFFMKEIKRPGASTVRSFVNSIRAERRRYKVVCAVAPRIANLLRHMGHFDPVTLKELPPHARQAMKGATCFAADDQYVLQMISAPDAHQAAAQLANRLSAVRALMVLPAQRFDVSAKPDFYVFTPRATTGQMLTPEKGSLEASATAPLAGWRLRSITRVPRQLEKSFDEASQERLLSALATASVAFETPLAETRLISFWSAFEVLLSDPHAEDVRIMHYVKHLVPCVTFKYQRRIFAAVYEALLLSYQKKFRKILKGVAQGASPNQHTRFAKLIVLPEYEQLRSDLLDVAKSSPLARHRLFRLHKYYGTPEECRKTLIDHSKRVEWQLHRIYRASNNLVHAGRSPLYLDSLVRNSLEYFRTTVVALARNAAERPGKHNIDQIVAEVGFGHQIQLAKLDARKRLPFDSGLVESIFGPI